MLGILLVNFLCTDSMKRMSFIRLGVSFVCSVTEAVPFCELLIHRNVNFLKNLQKFHSQHLVIGYLVRHSGKNELHELSDIL